MDRSSVSRRKEGLKIPHMGWNSLSCAPDGTLFEGLPDHPYDLFCPFLLLKGERSADRKGYGRVRRDDPCLGGERQCFRLSVSPGKEWGDRASHSEKFHRKTGGVKRCLQRELFHVWM